MNHAFDHFDPTDSFQPKNSKMKQMKAGKGKSSSENAPIFLRSKFHYQERLRSICIRAYEQT